MDMTLELHIEELILSGFAMSDRHTISTALQQELHRLFSEQGVPRSLMQSSDVPHLNGGEIQVTATMPPQAIGVQIAQSLYGGFQQ
ncbi:MAG: hypothetical protein HC881_14980 [Leptolyngbyaceae cyanobacterium SL_7_1]|nr:hypothetical protein [Leptolyngbyaceae cyanobacterium SL_7_1]